MTSIRPMLATTGRKPFDDPDWSWEPKYDGFRLLARVDRGNVQLFSRRQHTFTALYGPVTEALAALTRSVILDGEAVMLGPDGRSDFEAMLSLMARHPETDGALVYVVFDLLSVDGISIVDRPLHERRQLLAKVLEPLHSDRVKRIDVFPGWQGVAFFEEITLFGLEGVVGKRLASRYRPGERTPDWLKVLVRQREEFVVCGYIAAEKGDLSALVLGQWQSGGKLVYQGVVGTGVRNDDREVLLTHFTSFRQRRCPFGTVPIIRNRFSDPPRDVRPQWIRPSLLVEVEFRQRTPDGLRHPSYRGLRLEKSLQQHR